MFGQKFWKGGIEYLVIAGQHQLLTGSCKCYKVMKNITHDYKSEINITKSSLKWNTLS